MPNGFGAVLSAMLITMFSFMGAEIVTIARRGIRHAGKTYCPRHQLGYLAYLYFLFVFYFCRCGINPVEYARAESRWFLSLGSGIAHIPHAEINPGLRGYYFP